VPCGQNSTSSSPEILPLELLVLADIGRDHLLDLPGAKQLADAFVVDARVVAREGEANRSGLDDPGSFSAIQRRLGVDQASSGMPQMAESALKRCCG
jgi:hypothetical protein